MMEKSALGLKTSIGDFTKGLTLKGNQTDSVKNSYDLRGTKASRADYQAIRLKLDYQNTEGY